MIQSDPVLINLSALDVRDSTSTQLSVSFEAMVMMEVKVIIKKDEKMQMERVIMGYEWLVSSLITVGLGTIGGSEVTSNVTRLSRAFIPPGIHPFLEPRRLVDVLPLDVPLFHPLEHTS